MPVAGALAETTLAMPDINSIAREITVRIEGPSSGSGAIALRNGNTYTVLTNAHVVAKAGSYTVMMPNGDRYSINASSITRLPELDVAILSFTSSSSYRVAELGSSSVKDGQTVCVGGWTRSGGTLGQRVFVSTEGILTETNSRLPQGYSLTYTNLVRAGMSGGPILNQQGQLIGINGLVRLTNSDTVVASGISIDDVSRRSHLSLPTDASPSAPTTTATPGATYTVVNTLQTGSGSVNSLAVGTKLVSGNSDGTIAVWDTSTAQLVRTWQGHGAAVNGVALSLHGRAARSGSGGTLSANDHLASASDDRTIKIWSLSTGKLIRTLDGHQAPVATVAFSRDGKTLASGSWDRTIKVWDVATGKLLQTLTGHTGIVSSIAITPDGKTLASGSQDTTIRLWNLATGEPLRTLSGHSLSVLTIAITADGKTLASGSGEGTIGLWNLSTGEMINLLKGHTDGVWSLAFAQDGQTLISGSWDRTIKLWNLNTAQLRQSINHSDYVTAVAILPNALLVSGSWNGAIEFWQR